MAKKNSTGTGFGTNKGKGFDLPKLTPRQERFAQEYLKDLNATRAYIRAGYSKKGADVSASKLLVNPRIAKAIEGGIRARSVRTEITIDWIVIQLAKEAQLTGKDAGQASRIRVLELLGKHFGMFKERIEHTGEAGGPIKWLAAKSTQELKAMEAKYDALAAAIAAGK